MPRLLIALLGMAVLLAAIIYSQLRRPPDFVSGVIEADEIRLGSRVGGRIEAVLVDEGDEVALGDTLLVLEPYDLLEREQVAAGELAMRDAELKRLRAGLRPQEVAQAAARHEQLLAQYQLVVAGPRPEEIAAAQSRLDAALAQQTLAQEDYNRAANLYQSKSISKAEFDLADESWRAARAQVEVRQNELAILQAGSREQEIAQAKASVDEARLAWELAQQGYRTEDVEAAAAAQEAARAALEAIRRQKQELRVIAPSSGIIDALDLQPGDLVAPNAPVMTLLSNQRLWVRAYVPQRFLQIQVGQTLRVTLDAYPSEAWEGTVSFISQQSEFTPSNVQTSDDRATQVYRIRVSLPADDRRLKPGMTANLWLDPQSPAPR
jgi:multidrug resistance efflux pump